MDMKDPQELGMVGVPGTKTFVFQTPPEDSNHIRGVPCDITFGYYRIWEGPESAAETKTVSVSVV